ncbi:MAG TPA: uracil-DNA glycosylase [Sphingobium sp.]|uniref:uracil-DNA glycosylase n=1 Tax=Sphingobium sp. TaxID=1912891 RepID=UPI002ED5DBC7
METEASSTPVPQPRLEPGWLVAVGDEFQKPYMADLKAYLVARKDAGVPIFPKGAEWFRALDLTPPDKVRVVILGQDPYHGPGQAHGLCFSVKPGVRPPPSLVNIYKELGTDLGIPRPAHGFLEHWASQGVLLLNTVLTVEMGQAASHRGKGWERFTDAVIAKVNALETPVVFLLWGSHAKAKAAMIDDIAKGGRHLVLTSAHPSPLSAYNGFFGSRHFSRANAFLEQAGLDPIDWTLPPLPSQ